MLEYHIMLEYHVILEYHVLSRTLWNKRIIGNGASQSASLAIHASVSIRWRGCRCYSPIYHVFPIKSNAISRCQLPFDSCEKSPVWGKKREVNQRRTEREEATHLKRQWCRHIWLSMGYFLSQLIEHSSRNNDNGRRRMVRLTIIIARSAISSSQIPTTPSSQVAPAIAWPAGSSSWYERACDSLPFPSVMRLDEKN